MPRIPNLLLAALIGFSALPFGSCKSEIDKAGETVNESTEKAKEQTGRALEKAGQAIKEAGEKMQDSGKAGTRATRSPSTAPTTSTLSDSDLENAVRAKLANDAQLKEANLSVIADAARNEITLSGTVRTRGAREKAIQLAKSAKPGVAVNDKIDVKPGA
jgi:osmotically-inducible protein OsmY